MQKAKPCSDNQARPSAVSVVASSPRALTWGGWESWEWAALPSSPGWNGPAPDCIWGRTNRRMQSCNKQISQGLTQTPKLSVICFTLFYSLNSLFGFISVGLSLGLHFHSLKAFESYSPVCFPVRAQHVSGGEMKSSDKNVNAAGGPSAEQAGKQLVRVASTVCNYIQICP